MGGLSIWHWIIVGGVVFILFGGKFKVSDVMGDVAKGIKAFKDASEGKDDEGESSKDDDAETPEERAERLRRRKAKQKQLATKDPDDLDDDENEKVASSSKKGEAS